MTKAIKGIYTLLIKLDRSQTITIGKMGKISFSVGYYAYVGSALNGLDGRIVRHLRKDKLFHWHIDYFLQKAQVAEVLWSSTDKNEECALAGYHMGKLFPIPRFGCSDCRCRSHLFFSKDRRYLRKTVKDSFTKSNLLFAARDVSGNKNALGGTDFFRR